MSIVSYKHGTKVYAKRATPHRKARHEAIDRDDNVKEEGTLVLLDCEQCRIVMGCNGI